MINSRYDKNIFCNKPKALKDASLIEIIYHNVFRDIKPYLSIIMPIYNQENIIKKNIQSILDMTEDDTYELIFIIDACSDNSEKYCIEILSLLNNKYPLCVSCLILKSKTPLFETSSDNLGLYCSNGKYAIEIQADMEIVEKKYNKKIIYPFTIQNDIIGISGRCCHGLNNSNGIGKLGAEVEKPLSLDIDKEAYYICETCNRGPLALDIEKVRQLGYFDEQNYFLDNSDHDLFARAYDKYKWKCGYVPIEVKVNLENGSTRKQRDPLNQKFYNMKKEQTNDGKNGFLYNYKINAIERTIQKFKTLPPISL